LLFPNATACIRHATLTLAITLDLYNHVLLDIYKEATAAMERPLGDANKMP
jgi:hypothetical protein